MDNLIFIFSLPRAGSTLLQRLLMGSDSITSVDEPWILLPLVYAEKEDGILSEFSCASSSAAINSFIEDMPNGKVGYRKQQREFLINLYSQYCKSGEKYFLDKTPRYYYIIPEISEIFPNAKFIFLFRNPLQVVSSVINTWSNGDMKELYKFKTDISLGFKKLSEGYELLGNRAISIKYEDLVTDLSGTVKRLFSYLELEYDEEILNAFTKQKTKGKFGDPTGVIQYSKVESGSLKKWETVFSNRFRLKYAINYLNSIPDQAYGLQGYDKEDIVKKLTTDIQIKGFGLKDAYYILRGDLIYKYNLGIYFGKRLKKRINRRYLS